MAAKSAKVSMAKFNQMKRKIDSGVKKTKRIKAVADEKVQYLIRTTEVVGAATLAGAVRGWREKNGKEAWAPFGIPAELLGGAVLHIAGLAGWGGARQNDLHAFGDGFLAVGMADVGMKLGREGLAGLKALNPMAGQRLNMDELRALRDG